MSELSELEVLENIRANRKLWFDGQLTDAEIVARETLVHHFKLPWDAIDPQDRQTMIEVCQEQLDKALATFNARKATK